jgi:hypothetical protein
MVMLVPKGITMSCVWQLRLVCVDVFSFDICSSKALLCFRRVLSVFMFLDFLGMTKVADACGSNSSRFAELNDVEVEHAKNSGEQKSRHSEN